MHPRRRVGTTWEMPARTSAAARQREYAVAWRGTDGSVACGCLKLTASALTLNGSGSVAGRALRLAFGDVAAVRVGRAGSERLRGARSIVLEMREGDDVVVAPLAAREVLELAELLSACCNGRG